MDIRIGITESPRELNFETSQSVAEIEEAVTAGLATGSTHIRLTDNHGKVYIIPTSSLAYLEIGTEKARSVGFVA